MNEQRIIYVNNPSQVELNDMMIKGLEKHFRVDYRDTLTLGLASGIANSREKEKVQGLVTNFPYDYAFYSKPNVDKLPTEKFYKGLYHIPRILLSEIRESNPNLGILVYSGAGCKDDNDPGSDSRLLKDIMIASGANDVVFKNEPAEDVDEIVERMKGLVGVEV